MSTHSRLYARWWPWVAALCLMAAVLLASTSALAQQLQAIPALSARVTDTAALLSADERQALEAQLAAFEAEAGPQMAVLLLPSTAPEDITSYAHRVADAWKLGRREVGDGLLIVVASQDRKVRIEVAKALEGAVPDLAARRVIRDHIAPAFKAGRYAEGLQQGIAALQDLVRGEGLPAPQNAAPAPSGSWDNALALFLILGLAITLGTGFVRSLRSSARSVPSYRGSRRSSSLDAPIIWGSGAGNSWGGGGFGGGGDSGGFSSGGGGDFGGGGASGDW
ncbi:TPM domain-containing protein [Roseateles sp. BYS180W]|uniref:TPM domain-containing protein n=1 Tax=Roseateles rivi TaxID=3299028 RepID=A0ABW7FQW2_9BURK